MPPRYAYWTILVDGGPTAFRAAEPDELLPTLKRLQVKQPGATMQWFEKGRLWASRDEAKEKLEAGYTVGPDGSLVAPAEGTERRTKSWRPGGEHRDPREKYQLAKKAKWQKFKQMVRARPGHGPKPETDAEIFAPLDADDPRPDDAMSFEADGFDVDASEMSEPEPFARPDGPNDEAERDDAPPATDWRGRPRAEGSAPAPKRAWSDRPKPFDRGGDRPRGPRPEWRDKPQGGWRGDKPQGGGWRGKPGGGFGGERPAWKPRPDGDRAPGNSDRGPRTEWRDRPPTSDRGGDDRPRGPRPEWRDKPQGGWRGDKPQGGGWRGKPGGGFGGERPAWKPRPDGDRAPGSSDRGPRPEWRDRPKPFDRGGDDRPRGPRPEWRDKPQGGWRDKPQGGWRGDKPQGGDWRGKPGGGFDGERPAWKPRPDGDRGPSDSDRGPRPEWRDRPKTFDRGNDRPRGPKPEWRDKPQGGWRGDRPQGGGWRGKPSGGFGGDRPAWKPRPDGDRPPKPEWRSDKPKTDWRGGPAGGGDRPRGPKPGGSGGFSRGPKPGGYGGGPRGRSGPPRKKY